MTVDSSRKTYGSNFSNYKRKIGSN